MLRIQNIYITIRACGIILAKRSIAPIFDSIDTEPTSETVTEITKFKSRLPRRGALLQFRVYSSSYS